MREPAETPERRRGEEGALGCVAVGTELGLAVAQHLLHTPREAGSLHGHLAVALDEGEDDVLALQRGQQVGTGCVAVGVRRDLLRQVGQRGEP